MNPRALRLARGAGRLAIAYAAALTLFGAFVLTKGANPMEMYADMWRSLADTTSFGEVLVKAAPLVLAALAVAIPARAGLVNVGGEGQVVVGAVAAAGVALALDASLAGGSMIVVMMLAAAAAGALWAGIAGLLRLTVRVNEAITTLLLNYIAIDLMLYLIYQPWKDPNGSGQPATRSLAEAARLPLIGTSRVHTGVFIAVAATAVIWALFRYTTWGFRLRVVGGNPEAARRAGLPVAKLLMSAHARRRGDGRPGRDDPLRRGRAQAAPGHDPQLRLHRLPRQLAGPALAGEGGGGGRPAGGHRHRRRQPPARLRASPQPRSTSSWA